MGSPRKSAVVAPATATPSTNTPVSSGPAIPVTLADVIAATKVDSFVYTSPEFHTALIASGDVEVNPDIKSAEGLLATRATPKAIAAMSQPATPPVAAVPAKEKPSFVIEADIPIPDRTRNSSGLRAGRTPVYPFDALELGQSFFVPNPANGKSAAKAMASTVAGANARYVEEIPGSTRVNRKGATVTATKQLRKFKIFDTERDVTNKETGEITKQKGARIFRVKLDTDALPAAPTA